MYVIKDNCIKLSVRNLVEFILSSGDIDNRFTGMPDVRLMQEGTRLHKKIQKSMGTSYKAEVPLKLNIPVQRQIDNKEIFVSEYSIILEGRADGIICELEEDADGNRQPVSDVTIDEIKTVRLNLKKMDSPVYVHKAQAMCYGYIYALQNGLEKINIQMTYCNTDTEQIKRFNQEYTFDEISRWFNELIDSFKKWTDFLFDERYKRQESIKECTFPFEYRKGQKKLVVGVYRAVENEKNLFIQAPTGTGKTISTVFPAVQAMGQGYVDKIFYLTSKTITRTVARDAYNILRDAGLYMRTIILTAKDKICKLDERKCNPVHCEYAKGHFDRVNAAVYDMIVNNMDINADTVREYAEKYKVCPFEMSLDASYWCDGIICDYNYTFDPDASLKRYFGDGGKDNYLFLVDEAHNLVDRARQMYSACLKKEDFLKVKNIIKDVDKRLAAALEKCNKELLKLKRECDTYKVIYNDLGTFPAYLERCFSNMQKFFDNNKGFEQTENMLELFFDIRHFLNMYDCLDDKYIIYTEHDFDGNFLIKLYCVDPSGNLSSRLAQARSTIFFSATLLPVNYYKEMISGNREDMAIYAESVFDTDRRRIVIGTDVSSRYSRRNANEYKKISRYIFDTIQAHRGKYMIFCPSYAFMKEVAAHFKDMCMYEQIDTEILIQTSDMTEQDKEDFLYAFNEEGRTIAGFCVIGGIFSEGIDLKEDSLIGVIIVGTGLPMICRQRELLRGYFDENDKDGYAYAYVYPGMNKVLQAAGRVIRTVNDCGIIELLDDRFMTSQYTSLYPREWNEVYPVAHYQLREILSDFWEKIVQ